MAGKVKKIVSYKKMPDEVRRAMKSQYPNGFVDSIIKVQGVKNDPFYAVVVNLEEAEYLVKIDYPSGFDLENDDDDDGLGKDAMMDSTVFDEDFPYDE